MRRFDKWSLHYIIGLQKSSALLARVELAELALAGAYQAAGTKQRMIGQFEDAARTWDRERHVIARLEHDARGANPRVVFPFDSSPNRLNPDAKDVAMNRVPRLNDDANTEWERLLPTDSAVACGIHFLSRCNTNIVHFSR